MVGAAWYVQWLTVGSEHPSCSAPELGVTDVGDP